LAARRERRIIGPMPAPLNLVFLGSDPIALPLLDWLAGEGSAVVRVDAVYTQPDRAAGRGQKVEAGPIKRWAEAHAVPVRQPAKLTEEERAWLADRRPEVALVLAYGHILGERFLSTPRLGTFNLHASLLPKYRGASPIQAAVAGGDRETGLSLMRLVSQLDAGPVAEVERVPIGPLDTAAEIEARLAAAAVPLLARTLPRLARGELEFREQDHTAATYCRRLTKDDGALDFTAPAAELAARINGLFPWPGCTVEMNGVAVRLGLADTAGNHAGATAGTVIGPDAAGLRVATGRGVLRLRRLQRPGGRMLPAADFLRGFPVLPDLRLASRPMPPLVGPRPLRGG
jgi:methionyl-tRNA formyltransferase